MDLEQVFKGKQVAIVGAGGRMGQAIAKALKKFGAVVIGVDTNDKIEEMMQKKNQIDNDRWVGVGALDTILGGGRTSLVIDFSAADAVLVNLGQYIKARVPFVIGTTSWEYEKAENEVVSGVVDQNMHPVLVALLDALRWMVKKYPTIFKGYGLHTSEEHQVGKEKESGTAPIWTAVFEEGGATVGPIIPIRDDEKAHAFHWYDIIKGFIGKAATRIQINTLIWGVEEYAYGALLAGAFLLNLPEDAEPQIYSMRDVLSA